MKLLLRSALIMIVMLGGFAGVSSTAGAKGVGFGAPTTPRPLCIPMNTATVACPDAS